MGIPLLLQDHIFTSSQASAYYISRHPAFDRETQKVLAIGEAGIGLEMRRADLQCIETMVVRSEGCAAGKGTVALPPRNGQHGGWRRWWTWNSRMRRSMFVALPRCSCACACVLLQMFGPRHLSRSELSMLKTDPAVS